MESSDEELAHDDCLSDGVCPECGCARLMWDTGKLVCLECGYQRDLENE
jgi:uncharacterized Zn finger protein (UPF0148 family)